MRGDCLLKLIMIKGTIGSKLPDRKQDDVCNQPIQVVGPYFQVIEGTRDCAKGFADT